MRNGTMYGKKAASDMHTLYAWQYNEIWQHNKNQI